MLNKDITKLKIKTKKMSLYNAITILLVGYITISTIFPPVRVRVFNNTFIVAVFFILWAIITFFRNPSFYLNPTIDRFAILFFIGYTFIAPYIFDNGIIGNRYLNISPIYFLYLVFDYNKIFGKNDLNKKIVFITIPFILLTLFNTGKALLNDPYVSRNIKNTGEQSISLLAKGVGGYEFIYFLVLLTPILVYIGFLSNKAVKMNYRILSMIGSILVISIVVISNYFTALITILSAIMIMLIIRLLKKQRFLLSIALFFIMILLLLVGEKFFIVFIDLLLNFIDEGLTADRLYQMKYSLIYGGDQLVSTMRWDLIRVGVNSFVRNPLLGNIANDNGDVLSFENSFGQHSHFIDTFALFGFFIGLLQIYIIFKPFLSKIKTKVINELTLAMIFSIFIIFTFNTVTPSMGLAISFMYPVLYEYYSDIEKINK